MNNGTVKFGKLIEDLRRSRRLSQEELAFRCNIGRNSMSYIETGKSLPSLETFVNIAINLEMNPDELFVEIQERGILEEILKKANKPKK
ncbi:helix-turn-helix transcriptional regulator [Neobacillus pocheonensis]|uniref:helix-turn-helix domain-containing protein n=1 Tax=Neobacillus pocheonensis TaxID=363869 RepID=UPI003D270407